jgi:hypothetical protein
VEDASKNIGKLPARRATADRADPSPVNSLFIIAGNSVTRLKRSGLRDMPFEQPSMRFGPPVHGN